jgi:hypothetical protein
MSPFGDQYLRRYRLFVRLIDILQLIEVVILNYLRAIADKIPLVLHLILLPRIKVKYTYKREGNKGILRYKGY